MAMKIICSGCGETIPFSGEVCPHCHRNKSDDQMKETEMQLISFVAAIAALISGVVIYQFGSLKSALITGVIVGAVVAGFMSWSINASKPK
ncbi:hypothetical protein [Pseudomonas sp. KCJK9111]|uniref:hypothetical protein n=1 Tax=Pseudomonas sp. KCJK9111 TaxID=3344555 RepID=UPI0039065B63